jgi:ActR/RegA family two-component response regulator
MSDMRASVPSVPIGCALLVSNDQATIERLSKSMQQLALSTDVCSEIDVAPGLLNGRKFGAIVVDLQLGNEAQTLPEKVRHSPSNRTSVILAISDSDMETAVAVKNGSNFVLRRPLSGISIDRTLKAAYGLILREQRRYFRCPVEVPVAICRPDMPDVHGQTLNISEGGIAIATSALVKTSVQVEVRFTLPDQGSRFAVESTICWCKEGYIGLQFSSLPPHLGSELQEWLSRRLEESLPESVANQFRN